MYILEELYTGNVRPGEQPFQHNSQYAKALAQVVEAGNALTNSLSDRQKDLLKNYMNAQREVSILTDCDTFINGFQIGAKIMLDVLTEGEMREI
ncbi:MAG: DUF6809 family protein [Candidatus Limivicinus sp.]|nr:hypothetical protein [Clostridiales bacterium]MDY6132908.1 hypothetical protein [Candidatus Limivicinus sp.]